MDLDLIRHFTSVESGRRVFEPPPVEFDPMAIVQMQKAATADPELLELAAWASPDGDSMEMYETLGGGFSKAAQYGRQKKGPGLGTALGVGAAGGGALGAHKGVEMGGKLHGAMGDLAAQQTVLDATKAKGGVRGAFSKVTNPGGSLRGGQISSTIEKATGKSVSPEMVAHVRKRLPGMTKASPKQMAQMGKVMKGVGGVTGGVRGLGAGAAAAGLGYGAYKLLKSRMKQASVKLALGAPMFQMPQTGMPNAPGPATASMGVGTPSLKPPTPNASTPGAGALKPQTPQLGQGAGTQSQGQQPGQAPKIKVQLQPQSGASQGTSVSVG